MRIGQIFKDMVYGAGGAIATRAGASIVSGFVPAGLAGSPLAGPIVQAVVAVVPVRWLGKRFLGQQQGDIMMLGGLISAGLAAADSYFPNIQGQITGILRSPISAAPQAALPAGAAAQIAAGAAQGAADGAATAMAGLSDVEEVPDSIFDGLGDVEEVPSGIFA